MNPILCLNFSIFISISVGTIFTSECGDQIFISECGEPDEDHASADSADWAGGAMRRA
jgi:hypothetical protein